MRKTSEAPQDQLYPATRCTSATTNDVDHYSFKIDSLVSSYPARDDPVIGSDRERVTARLADSVILAKHLGGENLRGIRRYCEQYQMPKMGILLKALKLYIKQTV